MSRVALVLTADVEDGNTGDLLWAAGSRVEVDRRSAAAYLKAGVAVLADGDPGVDVDVQGVAPEVRAALDAAGGGGDSGSGDGAAAS